MIFQTLSTVQTSSIISLSEMFREDNKEEQRYGSAGQVMIHQGRKVMASGAGGKKIHMLATDAPADLPQRFPAKKSPQHHSAPLPSGPVLSLTRNKG